MGSGRLTAAAVAVGVLATRLPCLGSGYGREPDAWRIPAAARATAETGRYVPSRFGNNPLHDVAMIPFEGGGPWVTNLTSAVAMAVAAALVYGWLRLRGAPRPAWGALAWTFLPGVFVASTSTKDYALGLLLYAASLLALQGGRPAAAGLAAGAMTATRLSLAPLGLPLAMAAAAPLRGPGGVRAFVLFCAGFWSVVALAYGYVYSQIGWGFLIFDDIPAVGLPKLLYRAGPEPWGLWGCLVWIPAACGAFLRKDSAGQLGPWDRWWLAALAAYPVLLFFRVPAHSGYLLPAVLPVTALIWDRLPDRWLVPLALVMVASGLSFGMALPDAAHTPPPGPSSWSATFGGKRLRVEPLRGPILLDQALRRREVAELDRLLDCLQALPPGQLALAGALAPKLQRRWTDTRGGRAPVISVWTDASDPPLVVPGTDALRLSARSGGLSSPEPEPLKCPPAR